MKTPLVILINLIMPVLLSAQVSLSAGDHFWNKKSASGPNEIFKPSEAVKGLLDDASFSDMRSTLGLAIGTNVQAYDAGLASISGLTTAANKGIYTTGSDTYATFDLTSQARALLDDADATAMRNTLGLGTSAWVQFSSVYVDSIGTNSIGRSSSGGNFIVRLPETSDENTYEAFFTQHKSGYIPLVADMDGLVDVSDEITGLIGDGNVASAAVWNAKQDALASASASVSVNNQKLTNVAVPTTATDAATKGYVDDGMRFPRGHIYGLTLSNNVTDATNDIDVAAGECVDSLGAAKMVLGSPITKRLDAPWAVGSGSGGLDSGSIANTTYHVYVIKRSDTGVVDALYSTSATAPTLPANYDSFRRIGSIRRISGAIWAFAQLGDRFYFNSSSYLDRSSTAATGGDVLLTVTVPSGIRVRPMMISIVSPAASSGGTIAMNNGDAASTLQVMGFTSRVTDQNELFFTNTSAQILYNVTISSGTLSLNQLYTFGYIDTRGN